MYRLIEAARPCRRPSPRSLIKGLLALLILLGLWILLSSSSAPEGGTGTLAARFNGIRRGPRAKASAKIVRAEEEALKSYADRHLAQSLRTRDFLEFAQRLRLFAEIFEVYCQTHPEHIQDYRASTSKTSPPEEVCRQENPRPHSGADRQTGAVSSSVVPYPASPLLWDLERELFP